MKVEGDWSEGFEPPESREVTLILPLPGVWHRPPRCSVKEEYLNGRRGTSVQGKRTAEYAIRVLAKNLTGGTVTVRAQSKARTLAEVEQRINPKLRQDRYEFQLVEFLKTVKELNLLMPDLKADSSQTMEAALERNEDGAGLGQGQKHRNQGGVP